jgi:hypothetical protein
MFIRCAQFVLLSNRPVLTHGQVAGDREHMVRRSRKASTRSQQSGSGCGLAALCVVVLVLIGKCAGNPSFEGDENSGSLFTKSGSLSPAQTTKYVAVKSLNCRTEPGRSATVARQFNHGDSVTVDEDNGEWSRLSASDDGCWVASRLLAGTPPAPLISPIVPTRTRRSPHPAAPSRSCGSKRYCGEMNSCAEANYYLNTCGVSRLDGDGDGTPCESICG